MAFWSKKFFRDHYAGRNDYEVGPISLFLLFGEALMFLFTITLQFFIFNASGTVCTAYTVLSRMMKQLNPFTIMLIINMEPIMYPTWLLIFGESELMSSGFYIGLLIILFAIVSNSIVKVYKN